MPASMNALISRRPHPVPPAVWPVPGITMCFELGSVLAISSPHTGGVTGSISPDMISVGIDDCTGS